MAVPSGMNTGDWIGAAQNIVSAAAIIGGAAWGYVKFVKGRTFHRRAELTVDASFVFAGTSPAIRVKATFENTGGANIPLRAKAITVETYDGKDENGTPAWREVAIAPLFREHDWIESEETIVDDVLVSLPSDGIGDTRAYRVTALVYERTGRRYGVLKPKPGGIQWTGRAIVSPGGSDTDQREKRRGNA
jgi:hypothetical protein